MAPSAKRMKYLSTKVVLLVHHGDYIKSTALPEQQKLMECGRQQAKNIAKELKSICGLPMVQQIVSSTMIFAKEAADITFQNLKSLMTLNCGKENYHFPCQDSAGDLTNILSQARIVKMKRTYLFGVQT